MSLRTSLNENMPLSCCHGHVCNTLPWTGLDVGQLSILNTIQKFTCSTNASSNARSLKGGTRALLAGMAITIITRQLCLRAILVREEIGMHIEPQLKDLVVLLSWGQSLHCGFLLSWDIKAQLLSFFLSAKKNKIQQAPPGHYRLFSLCPVAFLPGCLSKGSVPRPCHILTEENLYGKGFIYLRSI